MRVDRKAKCPACGSVHKHKIVFVADYQSIVHTCEICSAHWGQNPVIQYDQWKINEPPAQRQNVFERPTQMVGKR